MIKLQRHSGFLLGYPLLLFACLVYEKQGYCAVSCHVIWDFYLWGIASGVIKPANNHLL